MDMNSLILSLSLFCIFTDCDANGPQYPPPSPSWRGSDMGTIPENYRVSTCSRTSSTSADSRVCTYTPFLLVQYQYRTQLHVIDSESLIPKFTITLVLGEVTWMIYEDWYYYCQFNHPGYSIVSFNQTLSRSIVMRVRHAVGLSIVRALNVTLRTSCSFC